MAVYIQTGNHQFLNLDDDAYVTNNHHITSGITGKGIVWAFTSVEKSNWHPLTWLSHMADVQFYGMNPQGHHLTNIIIHTTSSLLLFLLLLRLTGDLWPTLFVAALFALHPLHVESVAWVAERKDVLSTFFWFLTLVLYSEYVAKQKHIFYILSLFSFVMGLLSKPMLVTLPIIMLLLDFWPLGRYKTTEEQGLRPLLRGSSPLIKEKILFFACSLLSGLITIYAQYHGGAIAGLTALSYRLRFENALVAYVTYIGKTFWPINLAVYYPIPLFIPLWQVISSLSLLLLLSAAAILARNKHPYCTVGWFWFLITLVPVIGIIQVGGQSMADRYSYIPVIGLFIAIAWGIPALEMNIPHRRLICAMLAGGAIITSAAVTWQQLGYWKNNITLFQHTLKITTGNYMIHNNLGVALHAEGDLDEAIQEYQKALQIFPYYPNAHYNLGRVLQAKGYLVAAIKEYQMTLLITPDDADAHYGLGQTFQAKGYLDEAIQEYRKALRINPNHIDAHNNLGLVFQTKGELDAAIQEYQEALRIDPNYANGLYNMGQALAEKSRIQ